MFDSVWLWLLVVLGLLPLAYYVQRMPKGRRRRRERPEPETFCAWCVYRDGEDCTNRDSPVYGQGVVRGCI
jgi:hypothetical protein